MSELLHLLTEISGIQPELLVFPSCVQPARVCQREDEMKTVWWGCSDTLTQTLSAETCLFSGFISISGATGNGKVAPLQLSHPPKKLPGAVTSAENGAVLSGRAAACMSADLLFTSTSSSHVESVPMS